MIQKVLSPSLASPAPLTGVNCRLSYMYESLQFTPVSGAGEASDGESTFWIILLLAVVLAAVGGVLYTGWKRGRPSETYIEFRDRD